LTQNRNYYGRALPRSMCLPSVYLMSSHMTISLRPFPLYLYTANNQILEVGMAWEPNTALWKTTNLNVSQCRVKSFVGQERLIGQFHVPFQKVQVIFNTYCLVLILQKIRVSLCVCVWGGGGGTSHFKIINIFHGLPNKQNWKALV